MVVNDDARLQAKRDGLGSITSRLAMVVNDDACLQAKREGLGAIASRLAPTGGFSVLG